MAFFLEDTARRVIDHPPAHFRVVGPPASGKTRLLIERFRALESRDEDVYIVTYSAANHRRLTDAVFEKHTARIGPSRVLTYSRLAAEVIEAAGGRPPLVVTDLEEHLLLQKVIAENESRLESELRSICRSDLFRNELRDACHTLMQIRADRAELWAAANATGLRDVLLLFEAFQEALESKGAVTYYDIAWEALRHAGRGRHRHPISDTAVILVDDFQDVDPGQFALLSALAPPGGRAALNVFGDPLGSVFARRGTQNGFLMNEFPRLYGGETYALHARRAVRGVPAATLEALLDVIMGDRAKGHLPVVEEETDTSGGRGRGDDGEGRSQDFAIEVVRDEMDEVYAVAARIAGLLGEGTCEAGDVAIVTNNKRSYAPLLAAAAVQRGIPLDTGRAGKSVFVDFADALLSLIDSPGDATASRAVLTSPLFRYFRDAAGENNGEGGEIRPTEEDLRAAIRDVRDAISSSEPARWMRHVAERCLRRTCEAHAKKTGDDQISRELSRLIDSWECYVEAVDRWGGRHDIRAFAALDAALSRRAPIRPGAVALLSCRETKGRYFSHVFVLGCSELLFPSAGRRETILPVVALEAALRKVADGPAEVYGARTASQRLEEEHHLLYIALTRSRGSLRVTAPRIFSGEDYPAPCALLDRTARAETRVTAGDRSRIPPQIRFARVWAAGASQEAVDPRLERLSPAGSHWPAPEAGAEAVQLTPFPLSQSTIGTYVKCDRKFFYRKALRLPEADSPPMRVGSLVHSVMAELNARFPTRADLVTGATPEIVRGIIDELVRGDEEIARRPLFERLLRLQLERMAGKFLDLEREEVDSYKVLWFEKPLDFNRGPWRFTGRLDRVHETATGHKVIVDYKSGKLDKRAGTIKRKVLAALSDPRDANWQVPLYTWGMKATDGRWPRAFTFMVASPDEKPFALTLLVCRDEEGVPPEALKGKAQSYLLESEIESVMERAERLAAEIFAPRSRFERTEKRSTCRTCDFRRLCRREDT